MRILAVFACVLLLGSPAVYAQTSPGQSAAAPAAPQQQTAPAASLSKTDPQKEADIRRLLELTGAASLVRQTFARMEKAMKPLMTHALPAGDYREKLINLFFERFNSEVQPEAVLNLAIPIYSQTFSDKEIKGLIQFYQTPLGQKTAKEFPKMQAEIAAAASDWGQRLGRKIMLEILAEHPDLAKGLKEAEEAAHHQ